MSTPWDITIYGTDGNPARISGSAVGQPPGGSTPGAARVLGPFPFAFDDVGLNDGIAFYTPTVGDVILEAWIEVTEAFDGTTPLIDISTYIGHVGNYGWWGNSVLDAKVDGLSGPWSEDFNGDGLLTAGNWDDTSPPPVLSLTARKNASTTISTSLPMRVDAANPLKVVVSQDGLKGGDPVGGTAGAGNVYLVVATPSLT